MGQTGRRTPDRYIDTAPHTMPALPVIMARFRDEREIWLRALQSLYCTTLQKVADELLWYLRVRWVL